MRFYIWVIVAAVAVGVPLGIITGIWLIDDTGDGGPGTTGQATGTVADITSFEQCAARGFPVQESYPRRCVAGGNTFVEDVGTNTVTPPGGDPGDGGFEELAPDLRLKTPHSHDTVSFPLAIEGEAAGWYFEGEFPIELRDTAGDILADGHATAQGDWMTTDFVPFTATINVTVGMQNDSLLLVLSKADPRGLGPERSATVPLELGH
jgi:hypothetical protein